MWQKFVLACRELCQPTIRKSRLRIAHRLFLQVSELAEELYGQSFLTPNMHLHGHLKETIERYGSIYGFWAFSFERYNGLLADFPTNKRSVEIQIMRRFQQVGFTADIKHRDFGEFGNLFSDFVNAKQPDRQFIANPSLHAAVQEPLETVDKNVWSDLSHLSVKQEGYKLVSISRQETEYLSKMYQALYQCPINADDLARTAKKYSSVFWGNDTYGSSSSFRCKNYKTVMAKWANDTSDVEADFVGQRPGKVLHYIVHSLQVDDTIKTHLLAVVEWFKKSECDLGYQHPVSVWQNRTQNNGPAMFLPIQRISGKCAWALVKQGNQKFLVISPFPHHAFS